MAFDMQSEIVSNSDSKKAIHAIVTLQFINDVFGPVKALQLFAAINELPLNYTVAPATDHDGWQVVLTCEINSRTERVIAKLQSIPAVIGFSRKPVTPALNTTLTKDRSTDHV